MPKRMVGLMVGENIPARVADLRQGLDPLPFVNGTAFEYVSPSTNPTLAIGPENLGGVYQTNTSGVNAFRYYPDFNTLAGMVTPTATFTGTPTNCDCGANFYAVCGGPPYLYVFNRSTHALISVATTGISSTIYGVVFSPDGTKMAIVTNAAPWVRIYNTSTWAYVDCGTVSTAQYECCFSADSSLLITRGTATPFFSVFNSTTGARTTVYTTSGTYATATSGLRGIFRHPTLANTFICACVGSPYICEYNSTTNAIAAYTAVSAGGAISSGYTLCIDPDLSEDAVYLRHAIGTTSPARTMTRFKISTRAPDANYGPLVFRNLFYGNPGNSANVVITYNTPYKITGTVRDISNNPVARVVRAYRRSNGDLLAQTTSDAATGNYDLRVPDLGPFDVQFMTAAGELLNDLFFAQTEPQPV